MTQSAKTRLWHPKMTAHTEERTPVIGKRKIHTLNGGLGHPKRLRTKSRDKEQPSFARGKLWFLKLSGQPTNRIVDDHPICQTTKKSQE